MFKCISPCSDLLGKCEKVHDKTVHAALDVCRDFRAIEHGEQLESNFILLPDKISAFYYTLGKRV